MQPPLSVNDKESFLQTRLGNHMYIKITTSDPELLRSGNTDIVDQLQGVEKVFWSGRLRLVEYDKYPLSLVHAPYSAFFIIGLKDNFQYEAIRLNDRVKKHIQPMPLITGVINYKEGQAFIGTRECPEIYDEKRDGTDIYPTRSY